MDRERRNPVKVSSVTASLSIGEDNFTNIPDGCRNVVMAAVISDSGELLQKMETPVAFYVTMLSYLKTREGIHELFGEQSNRHFAIKLTYSSVQADSQSYREKGNEVPKSIVRAENALESIIKHSVKGNDVPLSSFHDKAMQRYEIVSQTITKSEFDSINSEEFDDFNVKFSDSMAEA